MTFPEPPENLPSDAALADLRTKLGYDDLTPAGPTPDQAADPLTDGALRLIAGVAAIGTPPSAETAHRIARELIAARDKLARVTALVDHGLHSEDPDEHDCVNHPCWAVRVRRALGIEEVSGE